MLDWKGIGVNALWVIGLALCLAAVSHADWWAHSRRVTRRRAWGTPMFLRPFYAGLLLVAASLFLTWVAARVFRIGMLRYGKPLNLRAIVATVRKG